MEMMILSILTPALHCHWHITPTQQATITTVVFLGQIRITVVYPTYSIIHMDVYLKKETCVIRNSRTLFM